MEKQPLNTTKSVLAGEENVQDVNDRVPYHRQSLTTEEKQKEDEDEDEASFSDSL